MAVINGPVVIIPKVPMLRRKPSDWMEIEQSLDVKWNIAAKKVWSNDKKKASHPCGNQQVWPNSAKIKLYQPYINHDPVLSDSH